MNISRLMRTQTAISAFFLIYLLIACNDNNKEHLSKSEATIHVTITPGKPDAPTESIAISKRNSVYTLRVRRTDINSKLEKKIFIQKEDFNSAWRMVTRRKLMLFQPEEIKGTIYDFGEIRLHIRYKTDQNSMPVIHDSVWIKPLVNKKRVEPLIAFLANLVRIHMKDFKLFYFPRE